MLSREELSRELSLDLISQNSEISQIIDECEAQSVKKKVSGRGGIGAQSKWRNAKPPTGELECTTTHTLISPVDQLLHTDSVAVAQVLPAGVLGPKGLQRQMQPERLPRRGVAQSRRAGLRPFAAIYSELGRSEMRRCAYCFALVPLTVLRCCLRSTASFSPKGAMLSASRCPSISGAAASARKSFTRAFGSMRRSSRRVTSLPPPLTRSGRVPMTTEGEGAGEGLPAL